MSVISPLLEVFPPNRRLTTCDACHAAGRAEPAVAVFVSQHLGLCRNHAMEAANELAEAAEKMLEYASKPEPSLGAQFSTAIRNAIDQMIETELDK